MILYPSDLFVFFEPTDLTLRIGKRVACEACAEFCARYFFLNAIKRGAILKAELADAFFGNFLFKECLCFPDKPIFYHARRARGDAAFEWGRRGIEPNP